MPRRLALLLSDIVDSTALNSAIGDTAMAALWHRHDQLARALMRQWAGQEIGRTDGFLVAFQNADNAAAFALAYHRALDGIRPVVRARIGIHVGEVKLRQNSVADTEGGATRFNIDGLALPVAARLSAVAGARQTLVSDAAAADLASRWRLGSHGYWQLKGLTEPIELFELGDDSSEFVRPLDGDKAYQVVRLAETWRPCREIRNSLPGAHDAFVGRSADLRRMYETLSSDARLISVVGIGGVGKTSLVTQFARRWLGEFPGGAWFCDLAQARDVDGIMSAVAHGFDVSLGRADPRRKLADVMAGRPNCLVVLDNFEQVASLAPETVGYWLDRAGHARFVVTSRERLGLPGEHVVPLEPMNESDATDLFMRRSRANNPGVKFDDNSIKAVKELVQLLDGLPLAIELAVARLSVMSPQTMLARMGRRFSLLSARGGRSRRQSTLQAAFDWSWDLLNANERLLLAQASVFAGGFTLEAAESVMRVPDAETGASILDTVQSLVEKSFVRSADGRFKLLVSVREYATDKLKAMSGTVDPTANQQELERRHGRFFAYLQFDSKARSDELDNILAACRSAIQRQDCDIVARVAVNAWRVLETRGPCRVGVELFESALTVRDLSVEDRVALTFIHGRALLVSGDAVRARAQLMAAYDEARHAGCRVEEIRALSSLAELNLIAGRVDEAKLQQEEAIRGAEQLKDQPAVLCTALNGLGIYYSRIGQAADARTQFSKALEVARNSGERRWEGGTLTNLGNVEANLGNRESAKAYYDGALVVARELGERVWEGDLLCNLGLFKLDDADTAAARSDLTKSLAIARENGLSLLESVVLCNIGLLNEATGDTSASESAYRDALEVARRRGDRRSEGQFLGYLGLLIAKAGRLDEGRDCLLQGIAILRDVKDRMSLAIVLCRYAEGCCLWGEPAGAQSYLDEAAAIAAAIEVRAGSELAASLARARQAAGASSPSS